MNNSLKKSNGKCLAAGVCILLMAAVRLSMAEGRPEIGAASIRAEGPMLLYGDNLAGEIAQSIYTEPAGDLPAGYEFTRDSAEYQRLRESLERAIAGRTEPLPLPKEKADWRKLESRDRYTLPAYAPNGGKPCIIYLKNGQGLSKPYMLNLPEIWGLNPAKAVPGDAVLAWGVNLGKKYGLADATGKVVALLQGVQGYNLHSHQYAKNFFNMFILPEELKPGKYALYNHNGLGDNGWSKAAELLVVEKSRAPAVFNARQFGAVGDGVVDDTQALQKALEKAQNNGGGRVYLPGGRYAITQTLVVPENVTLCGESRDAVTIETSRYAPFTGQFPADALLQPPAEVAAKARHVNVKGKDYIAGTGYPIDWLPEYDEHTIMVRIQNRSGLENLTFEVTASRQIYAIVLVGGRAGMECEDVVVDRCRFLAQSTGLFAQWPDSYTTTGINIVAALRYFRFTRNEFDANASGLVMLGAFGRDGAISFNRFTSAMPHSSARTLYTMGERILIQGNIFENTGRGMCAAATHYQPGPVWRNCYLQNTLRNLRKTDGEMLVYETGKVASWGKVTGGSAAGLAAKPEKPWEKDQWRNQRVIIAQGRGMGQVRWIIGNEAGALEVSEPWLVAPDSSSTFALVSNEALENLHIGNEYFNCHEWVGIYGAGLRNVWVNNEMESVTGGNYLWKVGGLHMMALNLYLGEKYHERARNVLMNARTRDIRDKNVPMPEDLVQMFGNEIKACVFRQPGFVATRNVPDGGIGTVREMIESGLKVPGNPFFPMPGEEPGVGVFDTMGSIYACNPDNPALDALPVANRWNMVANCLFVECPVGILVGRRVENTVLAENTFADCRIPVKDSGLSTIRAGEKRHSAFQESNETKANAGK